MAATLPGRGLRALPVGAGTADHPVAAGSALEEVAAGLAEELVVVRAAEENVVTAAAADDVEALTARDPVPATAPGDDVGVRVADQVVGPVRAGDRCGTALAFAVDHARRACPGDRRDDDSDCRRHHDDRPDPGKQIRPPELRQGEPNPPGGFAVGALSRPRARRNPAVRMA